jgi:hypothetical protein
MVLHCGTSKLSADDQGVPITVARKIPDLNVLVVVVSMLPPANL